jgi:chromosome partitioning protein
MKGGVGKTTLTFNLAWFAAYKRKKKVLVVDLDPQSNASQYLMGAANYRSHILSNKGTVVNILEQFTPALHGTATPAALTAASVIKRVKAWTDGSIIDLIPSRLELAWTLRARLRRIPLSVSA